MKRRIFMLGTSLLALALPAVSQTTPSQLLFGTGAAPPPTSASTRVVGATGQQTLYYWVVARYPSGYSSPTGPASAFQTVGAANLSASNYVVVSWSAMPQATGYDVLRSTTPTFPAPAGCTACAVVLNTSGATVNDTGAALSDWPAAGTSPAVPAQAVLNLDNTSAAQPFVNVSLLSQKFSQVYRMVLVSGLPTAGNCAQWGSYGLLTDAGASCGTGSGTTVAAGTGILVSTAGSPPTSTVSADSATVEFLSTAQAGTPLYCASASGSATTYTCALNPTLTAYTAGMTVAWKVDTSCTGSTATTLNIDSLGAKSIKEADGSTDPVSGDCPANRQVTLRYDGTLFRIVGGGASGGSSQFTGFAADAGYWAPFITSSTNSRTSSALGIVNGGGYCYRASSIGPLTFNRMGTNLTGGDATKYYGTALYDSSGTFMSASTSTTFSGAGRTLTYASTVLPNAGTAFYVCLSSNATAGTESVFTFNYSALGVILQQTAAYGSTNLFSFTIPASSVDWTTPTAPSWPGTLPARTELDFSVFQTIFFTR